MANSFYYRLDVRNEFMFNQNVLPYQQGDRVFYSGQKHKEALTKEGKSLVGWVHSQVVGTPGSYIIFFPETKNQDSYVMSHEVLTTYRPPVGKREDGPVIQPRRKKKEDD